MPDYSALNETQLREERAALARIVERETKSITEIDKRLAVLQSSKGGVGKPVTLPTTTTAQQTL